jgi:hypothetical protein
MDIDHLDLGPRALPRSDRRQGVLAREKRLDPLEGHAFGLAHPVVLALATGAFEHGFGHAPGEA